MPREFDVIVAGAGSAGCTLAARIAEKGKHPRTGDRLRVAMVEAGPYWKGDPVFGVGVPSRRSQITHVTSEDVGRWTWPSGFGKAVGGSIVFFGSNAWLPVPDDFVAWRNATDVNWTWEGWQDALQEAREMFHIHPQPEFLMSKGTFRFKKACEDLGYKPEACPRSVKNCLTCGYCGSGYACRYDAKVSGLLAYVPIAERNGVEIIPDAEIQRVIIEKDVNGKPVAKGIEYTRNGTNETILAGKTIVSCNTIGSAVLLMRSGYGPAELLGTNLVVRNDNIGAHITSDTGAATLFALYDEDIMETQVGASGACHFILDDAAGYSDGVLRLRVKDSYMNRIAFPWEEAGRDLAPDFGWEHKEYMEKKALTKVGGVKCTVQNTKGMEARIVSFTSSPIAATLKSEGDPSYIEKRMKEGAELVYEILKKTNPVKMSKMPTAFRFRGFEGVHNLGSCRAGRDRKNSVVDSDFASHDVENLFVCDTSAIPWSGNCLAAGPAMAAGTYAWKRIVAEHFS